MDWKVLLAVIACMGAGLSVVPGSAMAHFCVGENPEQTCGRCPMEGPGHTHLYTSGVIYCQTWETP